MREILIDTRELEAPAPMQMVLSHLQSVWEGESYIHQIHRMVPEMLLNRLKGMDYDHIIKKEGDEYHIYIFFKKDRNKIEELIG